MHRLHNSFSSNTWFFITKQNKKQAKKQNKQPTRTTRKKEYVFKKPLSLHKNAHRLLEKDTSNGSDRRGSVGGNISGKERFTEVPQQDGVSNEVDTSTKSNMIGNRLVGLRNTINYKNHVTSA